MRSHYFCKHGKACPWFFTSLVGFCQTFPIFHLHELFSIYMFSHCDSDASDFFALLWTKCDFIRSEHCRSRVDMFPYPLSRILSRHPRIISNSADSQILCCVGGVEVELHCVQMPGHRRGAGAAGLAEGAGEPHPLLHAGVRLRPDTGRDTGEEADGRVGRGLQELLRVKFIIKSYQKIIIK